MQDYCLLTFHQPLIPFSLICLSRNLRKSFFLDNSIVGWILDLLSCRTQRVNGELSDLSVTSTGSLQGCVLSPLLYIMYTNDCRSARKNCHILKFADDAVILSLLNRDESSHGAVVDDFMNWCQDSFLFINVSKTKDMSIDFRHSQPSPVSSVINGQDIELVQSYRYPGYHP